MYAQANYHHYYSKEEIEYAKRHAQTCMLNVRSWYCNSKLKMPGTGQWHQFKLSA